MAINSTYGLIIRGTVDDMDYLLDDIEQNTDLNVVYQKASNSELYIADEKEWIKCVILDGPYCKMQ